MPTDRDDALRAMTAATVEGIQYNAVRLLLDAKLPDHLVLVAVREPGAEHFVLRGDSSETDDEVERLAAMLRATINEWLEGKEQDRQMVVFPDHMAEA